MRFPDPIPLPAFVEENRVSRYRDLLSSAKRGMKIRLGVIFFELCGVVWLHSSALFWDALASSLDLLTTLFLVFCVKMANRPPDGNHPFGHGRLEPIGGLLLGLLFVGVGCFSVWQNGMGSINPEEHLQMHPMGWIFPVGAVIFLEAAYQSMMHVAKQRHSSAIAADAVHYRIDALSSLLAAVVLLAALYWPSFGDTLDHVGAAIIGLFMVVLGGVAIQKNIDPLMDKAPDAHFFDRVRTAALRVEGVLGTEKIHIQLFGPDAHVDIDIEVDPKLEVWQAHEMSQHVRAEIQKSWAAVRDVTVHIEPYFPHDHPT